MECLETNQMLQNVQCGPKVLGLFFSFKSKTHKDIHIFFKSKTHEDIDIYFKIEDIHIFLKSKTHEDLHIYFKFEDT
jgi:hypothetical protein